MSDSRTAKAARGVATGFLVFVLQMAIQMALAPIVIHFAGADILGAFVLIMQMLSFSALTDFGFGAGLLRFLAKASGYDDQGQTFTNILTIGRTFLLLSNALLAIGFLAVSYWIGDLFKINAAHVADARISLWVLSAWLVIRTPITVYGVALTAIQSLATCNFINAAGMLVRLLLSIVFLMAGFSLVGLIAAVILAELLTCCINRFYFLRMHPERRPVWGIPDRALFKEMFWFGATYSGVSIGHILFYSADYYIAGFLFSASAVASYYATLIAANMYHLFYRIADSATPAFTSLYAEGEMERTRNAYLRIMRYSYFLVLPFAIGVLALNKAFVSLWVGPALYAGDAMTIAAAIFVVLSVDAHVNAMVLTSTGKMQRWTLVSLLGAMLNVALSFWLGHVIGLGGLMIASVLALMPGYCFLLRRSHKLLGIGLFEMWREILRPTLVVSVPVLMYASGLLWSKLSLGWIAFAISATIYLALWGASTWWFGLSKDERRLATNFVIGRGLLSRSR